MSKSKEINGVISESLNYSCSCISNFFLSPFSVGWIIGVARSCGGFVPLKMALKIIALGVLSCNLSLEGTSKHFSIVEFAGALRCYCDFRILSCSEDVQNKAFSFERLPLTVLTNVCVHKH